MKITLVQIDSINDKDTNAAKAEKYITEAAAKGTDIVCLAEDFLYKGDNATPEDLDTSGYVAAFKDQAKTLSVNIVLGSMLLASPNGGKPTNTTLVIDRSGLIVHTYDKQYMYDVERPDLTYHESDEVQPGGDMGIFTLEGTSMGVGICVDLRYPEYFRNLMQAGAEVVFLPANMRKITGGTAWDVLTKARAIENQFYFAACGQIGQSGAKERVGHSRIVSFDGRVISEIGTEEGLVTADIDLEALRAFRKEFPVHKQVKL
jgi:predicted amidohydrolase